MFKLFGTSLNTLYFAGYTSSVFIVFLVYCITKIFVDRKISLALAIVIVAVCVFSNSLFNFIFPYSYSAVFALAGFLFSLYTSLLYIKNGNKILLNLAFLSAGFSFANKIEYLPYFCFLFACLPFLLRKNGEWNKNWREYCFPIVFFWAFPIFSFGLLLCQGASFSDFFNAVYLIKKVLKAPGTEYFYSTYGLYVNWFLIPNTLAWFLKILKYIIPFGFCLYLVNFLGFRYIQNRKLKIVFNVSFVLLMLLILKIWYILCQNKFAGLFCWIGLFLSIVLCGFLIFYCTKWWRDKKDLFILSFFDAGYLFLLVSSLLVSFKGILQVSLECYGTYSVCVMLIPFIIFFVHYVPKLFGFLNKVVWKSTVCNFCVIIALLFLVSDFEGLSKRIDQYVKTDNGLIFVQHLTRPQQKLLDFIIKNTEKDSVLVSVPEGAIINFLTQRKGHSLYYFLIPNNVQAFGEDKILADFENNPPDYFLVNNFMYDFYNTTIFSKYAPKITDFIQKQYVPIYYIDNGLIFVLYKKKPMLK